MDFGRIASGIGLSPFIAALGGPEPLVAFSHGLGRDSMTITALLEGTGVLVLGRRYFLRDLSGGVIFSDTGIEWEHTYALASRVKAACEAAGVPFFFLAKPSKAQQIAWIKTWKKGKDQPPPWRTARYFPGERPTLAQMQRKAAAGGYHSLPDLDLAEGLYGRVTGKNTASCTERHKIIPVEEVLNDLLVMRYGITLPKWGAMASQGDVQPNLLMIGIAADEQRRRRNWAPKPLASGAIQRGLGAKRSKALLDWAIRKVYPLLEMGIDKADEEPILIGAGLPDTFKSGCFSCHYQPTSWFFTLREVKPDDFARVVAYELRAVRRQQAEGAPKIWTSRGEDLRQGGRLLPELVDAWASSTQVLPIQGRKGNLSDKMIREIQRVDPLWPRSGHWVTVNDLGAQARRLLANELLTKGYNRSCAAMDGNVHGDR